MGTLVGLAAKKNFQYPDKDFTKGKSLTQNAAQSRAPWTASSFQVADLETRKSTLLRLYQYLRDPNHMTEGQKIKKKKKQGKIQWHIA